MTEKIRLKDAKISAMLRATYITILISGLIAGGLGIFGLWKVASLSQDTNTIRAATLWMAVIGIVLLLCIVLAAVCIRGIKRTIADPLSQIIQAAEELSHGGLKARISYSADNEIGQLASSLNRAFVLLQADVDEISDVLERVAQGDLTAEVPREFQGDFAPITNSFHKALGRMNQMFELFQSTCAQVNNGAQQVSVGAQQLAQGSTEQAGSVEELSSAIMEVSQKINENSEHVTSMSGYMDETTKDVKSSNEEMKEMQVAMEGLSSFSIEIGKIIKVIDDIAFQTNILALNAAVEAARAGDAGKGFAVVADEVRSLASKSADAAKQTTTLIDKVVSKIKHGTAITSRTAKALSEVSDRIMRVDESLGKVDKVSSEQSSAVLQITQGIEQISSVVQNNSAAAEQSAAASEELSGQAVMLQNELNRFKIKKQSDKDTVPEKNRSGLEKKAAV